MRTPQGAQAVVKQQANVTSVFQSLKRGDWSVLRNLPATRTVQEAPTPRVPSVADKLGEYGGVEE